MAGWGTGIRGRQLDSNGCAQTCLTGNQCGNSGDNTELGECSPPVGLEDALLGTNSFKCRAPILRGLPS